MEKKQQFSLEEKVYSLYLIWKCINAQTLKTNRPTFFLFGQSNKGTMRLVRNYNTERLW